MLSGDNGILQKATDAKTRSDEAQIIERIQLAYHSALTGGQGSYTKESLESELEKEFGENNYNVDDSDNTNWILTAQGQNVTIPAGKKGTNPIGKLSEEQLKTKIQNESNDCMIDENGNIIPINVWLYTLNDSNETAIIEGYWDDDYDELGSNAYKGNIINGILEYNIPVFIKSSNKTYKAIELGFYALCGCNIESVSIPSTITKIGPSAFIGTPITSIVIPSGILEIEQQAFRNCRHLTSITFEGNVSKIGMIAFDNCTSITSITIPESVTNMGEFVFDGWTSTQTINVPFKENNKPSGWSSSWKSQCNAVINYVE